MVAPVCRSKSPIAAAHGIDGKAKLVGRGAETAAARDFQEHAGSVPVLQTAESDLSAFF